MSAATQFCFRAPKSVGLIDGSPYYNDVDSIPNVEDNVRQALYSPNGQYFAYTQQNYITIVNPDNGSVLCQIDHVKDCFDIVFSPNGSYLSVFEKPVKLENGNYHENIKILNVAEQKIVGQYTAKDQASWKPSFTADEKIIGRMFKDEIRFYKFDACGILNFSKAWSVLKIDHVRGFAISPGIKHIIATFVPEHNGKPSVVSVYNIGSPNPISTKSFFKADRCVLKWNDIGTALLALASTDVDASNKNYYGQSTLYLLGIAGSFDSRINLDKEGPIHDITWSPSSREFGVVYGYMPSTTAFFDARGNPIHSLPPAPKNTILFSPHGRYILVAGFGNLQGAVDIYDRLQKFSKISSFEASNTSVCKWSPDGRFILTGTTAPRLRVDNGVKIWYASGKLIYVKDFKEVNAFDWRPRPLESFPPIRALDENPIPHQSAIDYILTHAKSSQGLVGGVGTEKPKCAYRPPHARNGSGAAPVQQTLYQKEMSSSFSGMSLNGYSGSSNKGSRQRYVPGASAAPEKESKTAQKNRKRKEAKKGTPNDSASASDSSPAPASGTPASEQLIAGGVQSHEEKKIRGLLKKLRAIEQLKMKQANNETLEDTQLMKIQSEVKIRAELSSLGWSEES